MTGKEGKNGMGSPFKKSNLSQAGNFKNMDQLSIQKKLSEPRKI
jgi:hypothetical protein